MEDRTLPDRGLRPTGRDTRAVEATPADSVAPARADAGERAQGPHLDSDEELLAQLQGIGAVMFLTTQRVIVARDGGERRPRSGIQSFGLDAIRHLRLELGSAPSGRIAIWTGGRQEAVSMFFDARSLDRAHEFLDIARPLVARGRRRDPGARPARPPSGPADSGPKSP